VLWPQQFRGFAYKPKIQLIFDKKDEFHLYYYEKGDGMVRMLSRINVAFL